MVVNATSTDTFTVNLLALLKSDTYLALQNTVREAATEEARKRAKLCMPGIMPSGTFSHRGSRFLLKHTGLIAIDIDQKQNEQIAHYKDLKNQISKLINVAYCGRSVSGSGYWLLIPIAYPEKHKLHFRYIEAFFKSGGIIVDPGCSDVCRLRFYSYDPDAYYNHKAKHLQACFSQQRPKATFDSTNLHARPLRTQDAFRAAIDYLNGKGLAFTEGQKHEYLFHLCAYLCWAGITKDEAEAWIDRNLMSLTEITSNCITYPYYHYSNRALLNGY
jgi:hypothetical protein